MAAVEIELHGARKEQVKERKKSLQRTVQESLKAAEGVRAIVSFESEESFLLVPVDHPLHDKTLVGLPGSDL